MLASLGIDYFGSNEDGCWLNLRASAPAQPTESNMSTGPSETAAA